MKQLFQISRQGSKRLETPNLTKGLWALALIMPALLFSQKPRQNQSLEIGTKSYPEIVVSDGRDVRAKDNIPVGIYGANIEATGHSPEEKAENYLKENWAIFQLAQNFGTSVKHHATRKSISGTVVRFRQIFDGLDVDKNEFTIKLNHTEKIVHVQNSTVPISPNFNTTPSIGMETAYATVRKHLGLSGKDNFLQQDLMIHVINNLPYLVYRILIINAEKTGEWEGFVDANTGQILELFDISLNANGTGKIFNPDPLSSSGSSYGTGGFVDNNDANSSDLEGQLVDVTLLDITQTGNTFTLTGPWAAIVDSESPFNGLFGQNSSSFNFNRNQNGFEAVMCYYHIDNSMRYINNTLGIAVQPFQYTGGVRFDPHGLNGDDNSHYTQSTGELAWGEGCVDDAEDADVILHELGHGLHHWITNGSLSQNQGLSEGCGDYWGQSYSWSLGSTSHDFFSWDGHNVCWPGRTTNHDVAYPPSGGIHTQGQLWATVLMKIYAGIGREKTDRIFLEGLAMTNSSTNQKQAAEAVYQAAIDLQYSDQDLCIIYTHLFDKYAIAGTPPPCCKPYSYSACCEAPSDTHINTNTLFSTDQDMPGDIYVHAGAELLIEAKIGMKQGTRILVERNARLVIDNGGIVTKGCNAPDWAGIQVLGNSQKAQPERFAPLTDPDQAGIVWIDNAAVEWARCGVTAGGGYGQEYWGGLIWTNNTVFQNNRKDVEFMSYKFTTNRSRFFNTTFTEINDAFPNTEGVTIWETDDIEFHNCSFSNMDFEGIRTYDAGVRVLNGCSFKDNETGVSSYATYPMANKIYVGSGTGTENKFSNNKYHINASLVTGFLGLYSNGKFSLDVINNDFEGGEYGVIVEGPSNFRMAGNAFTGVPISSWVANTGFNNLLNQNLVGCNRYNQGQNIGIFAIGENKQMQFLANDFNMSGAGRDFVMTSSFFPGANGAIAPMQGNPFVPASNCFTNPGSQVDILTAGQWGGATDFFNYYYQSGEPPVDCKPEPLTVGNYGKIPVASDVFVVDCSKFGGLPKGFESPTPRDLDAKRVQLEELATKMTVDPSVGAEYYQTLQDKEAILKYLLGQALNEKDYNTAESLLAGEQSTAANWAIFGLRMDRKDYKAATQWLNQLPLKNDVDVVFRDIQLINIQRQQNPADFELSADQEAYLDKVAESASPVRGYARGILGLLKDHRYYPETYELGEERSQPAKFITTADKEEVRLYPVPASNTLNLSWPAMQPDANANLQIFDMLGRSRIEQNLGVANTQSSLDVSQLPAGVYFLVINDGEKPLHRVKFTIQR